MPARLAEALQAHGEAKRSMDDEWEPWREEAEKAAKQEEEFNYHFKGGMALYVQKLRCLDGVHEMGCETSQSPGLA